MLRQNGLHPVLARLYAARGVQHYEELATELPSLIPPSQLLHIEEAARLLADAINNKQRLVIVADYDCDGATACSVGVRGLRMLGGVVDYIVPNRFEYGYGLTPEIVALTIKEKSPAFYKSKWFWIGVGVVTAGIVIASSQKNDDKKEPSTTYGY